MGCVLWTLGLVEEQTVSPETIGQAAYCGVRDACFSGDLTKS